MSCTNQAIPSHGKLSSTRSLPQEMKWFTALQDTDPERKRFIFTSGEQLVALAKNGEFFKFRNMVDSMEEEEILMYFVIKALIAAVLGGHLMVAGYILDNGFPVNADGIPNILLEAVKVLEDYQCVPIISMLASKKMDLNKQEPGTWLAPLHIAVRRQLVESVEILLILGADANAVADGDRMPLNIAYALPEGSSKDLIIQRLLESGARETWRRSATSISSGGSSTSTTQIGISKGNKDNISCVHTIIGHGLQKQSPRVSHPTVSGSADSSGGNRVRFSSANLAPADFIAPVQPIGDAKIPLPRVDEASEEILPPHPPSSELEANTIEEQLKELQLSNISEDDGKTSLSSCRVSSDGAQLFSTG